MIVSNTFIPRDRSDILDPGSPSGLRVVQITPDDAEHANVYPETPIFLEDRVSFLMRRSDGYCICFPDDGYRQRKVIDAGEQACGMVVSPDGRYLYFIDDRTAPGDLASQATLWRIDTRSFQREEVRRFQGKLPGHSAAPSRFYNLGTVSRDGRRYATSAFLGNGQQKNAPFGVLVVDLQTGETRLIAEDKDFGNTHIQYCQADDPEASRDLMIQMNHGSLTDEHGKMTRTLGPPEDGGVDVHVIRDDGTNWRDLPWGRDGKESNIGHQIWRGQMRSAVTVTLQNDDLTYGWGDDTEQHVVEGYPVRADRDAPHRGALNPGARRNVLSRHFPRPRFCHLFVHASGHAFAFDTFNQVDHGKQGQRLYYGTTRDEASAVEFTYLFNTSSPLTRDQNSHAHPVLTPDGKKLMFNCRRSGSTQIYQVEGFN